MSEARVLNEWIRVLPQFHDPMNDYYPGVLWLDTESGTYGDARNLMLIDTTEWTQEDCDAWECMTDSERGRYGEEYLTTRGKAIAPLEYQRETGASACGTCDTGNVAVAHCLVGGEFVPVCEKCHND